ncbi:MAG: pyrroline-5-carboxylate reductase [SAR202 cluster bacterium]|nr:pyrroline-5-carboxylate reductase [SAR202 cluster bacterium]
MNISFVGGGTMAETLMGGILGARLAAPQNIRVGEPLEMRRAFLEREYGLKAHARNLDAVDGADITVLAVKPQDLAPVMEELNGALGQGNAVLSIVAGARMSTLVEGLDHAAVIRVMPNTPARIGAGMCVWTAADEVAEAAVAATREILRTMGEELYVTDEKLIDMATALSASGPAYVFQFIEALIDAGVYLGMPRDAARQLTLQTVLGSAMLAKDSGRHPAELKDMVTSPGGTTVEALLALEQGGFKASVMKAVKAAYDKSRELGEQG